MMTSSEQLGQPDERLLFLQEELEYHLDYRSGGGTDFEAVGRLPGVRLVQRSEELPPFTDCLVYTVRDMLGQPLRHGDEVNAYGRTIAHEWPRVVEPAEIGDIATYWTSPEHADIGGSLPWHIGVVIGENTIRSKFGRDGPVYDHPPLLTPSYYGRMLLYHRAPSTSTVEQ